jgi:DNA-binding NarL/FixJ family response regulator
MSERVLVIIDDPFESTTLVAALRMHEIDVIGEARNEAVATNMQRRLNPDVILLDMHLAGNSAIQIAINLRKKNPLIGIVVLESCVDLRLIGNTNREIPWGTKVVLKALASDLNILCNAISNSIGSARAQDEVEWIHGSSSLVEKGIQDLMAHLTDLQVSTLRLVVDGKTNAQIGREHFVSEKSVEQVISRLALVLNLQPDRTKNLRVQLVGEYYKWLGAPHH